MNSAVICADIGTSSLKAALVDTAGAVLFYTRIRFAETGNAERWYGAFCEAAAHAAAEARRIECIILGICISGNGPTISTCSGETLLWNETPVSPDTEHSGSRTPRYEGHSLFIPRLMLFKEMYPSVWETSPYIFSGPEYLIWRLTGEALTILPQERYRETYWTDGALCRAHIEPQKLPPFAAPADCAGTLTAQAALKTGLHTDIPVLCGAPDFIVALIGTDTLRAGTVCDRAGSSEGINLCIQPHPSEIQTRSKSDKIRILPSVIPALYNASLLIPDSGKRFSSFKKQTAPDVSYADFVTNIITRPLQNQNGLRLLSGIASEVKHAVDLLSGLSEDAGCSKPAYIRTTGGQAKNEAWLQYKADILGIPVQTMTCSDAELIGDAVLAFTGLHHYSGIAEGAAQLAKTSRTFEPQSGIFYDDI